jgi:hypothetical protein
MNLGSKLCTWPEGSQRIVQLTSILPNGKGYIIWNETHAPIREDLGCVVGLDDEVPLLWLSEPDDENWEVLQKTNKRS